ncbi:helix-turn-helix domain-containing protein [Marinibaculum pumilum]|uniref:Helix-turn-helix domain-containing protein n=1 Tax=Marinibaculum pumilum TaxID=1766165 RepID=A0ABV7L9A6_9PROT
MPAPAAGGGHGNRRRRTRKDLLEAAARLSADGHAPSMEEVAAEALVSRATIYRYFPNVESLLAEAAAHAVMPDPRILFADDPATDPVVRVDRAEAAMHEGMYAHEMPLRMTLAQALLAGMKAETAGMPLRQNRRLPLIEAALAPVRDRLDTATYDRLCQALCLVFGLETMVMFRDVLQVDPDRAREVKSWAIRALVEAALREAPPPAPGGTRRRRR